MKNNAEVKAAFEEAQKTLEDLATAQAVAPPSDLKSTIWNKIQQEQTADETTPLIPDSKSNPTLIRESNEPAAHKKSSWNTYAVAASVLFLISAAGNLFWINSQSKDKKEIAKLNTEKQSQTVALQKMEQKWNILSSPDMQMVMLKGVEKHPDSKAMVFWDKNTKKVYLNAENLPKAPEGMQYQLWAIADGKPVSAGMYTEEKDSKIALSSIPNAQAFAITLEKKGGSEVPTMENMYVMGAI
jgi:anti-sigma-K factor RskA